MESKKRLSWQSLQDLFNGLDARLVSDGRRSMELLAIGGAVLIQEGMDDRRTEDFDLFGNHDDARTWLSVIVPTLGFDFDPDDYSEPDRPYVQWVRREGVSMPEDDSWMADRVLIWSGIALKIFRPPWGILLCNKLTANRAKDQDDIAYLVSRVPNWESEVDRYINLFPEEARATINENRILGRLYQDRDKTVDGNRHTPRRRNQ